MKVKHYCRTCGEDLGSDYGYCPVCREDKRDCDVEERYFPDNPTKRVYAVDAYVTMCRCFKVEASNKDDAEEQVYKMIAYETGCPDDQTLEKVRELKLCFADNIETEASGEADESGNIQYY